MSKTWYPVIDLEKCIQCMNCVEFCPNGVYKEKEGSPFVTNPENCPQGCKGCSKQCPTNAIEYVGDTDGRSSSSGCGCSCGGKC